MDDLALLVFLGLAFVSAKTKCAKCAVGFQGDAQHPNIRIALIQIISIALILKYRKINAVLIKKFLSGELVALAN